MHDIDIILHDSVTVGDIKPMSSCQRITPSEAEKPAAADDRHFPHRMEWLVAAQYGEDAAVELPSREGQVHGHEEAHLILGRRGVHALGPTYDLGVHVRPLS
ncbi:hypothetical protein IEQ34_017228 [Dendrobium chrysotoxum]|uniref:Uncharacterized protein n=1 Tax=Dendrobium chrysotoxum TaxID=161865 RepID=A0AAV7GAP2_DENCH|nr:hypothetical protein IEQ34_017228 [Dendrobium chrysotoxum]